MAHRVVGWISRGFEEISLGKERKGARESFDCMELSSVDGGVEFF